MRAFIAFAALLCSRDLAACAPAPQAGQRIDIVEETAVIIWEPATKTQHFIRRATFQGDASNFGFLVPTPAAPTLAAVDDDTFRRLRERTAPEVVHAIEKRIDWMPLIFIPFATRSRGETATGASSPVEVLSTQKVGGYEAAILDATDAAALTKWLADNGYDTSPDLAEWLQAYIDQRWIISAFKIDKSEGATGRTGAVRMSFTTERPFFPYREPSSQREGGPSSPRVLSIFFVGPERVTGRIGGDTPWPGQLYWSDRIRHVEVGGVQVSPDSRLTAFEDHSTPRPGTNDLFFERDPDQKRVLPPPDVRTEYQVRRVPLDVVIAPVLVGGAIWWRRKRRVK